jgi:hypothetical protein
VVVQVLFISSGLTVSVTDRTDDGAVDDGDGPAGAAFGDPDVDWASRVEPEADGEEATPGEADPAGEARRTGARRRHAGFALGRAVVVLVAAAVVYEIVVPSTHTDRARLARLVPTTSGLAPFAKATPQAGSPSDAQTGLAAVTAAAKRSPGRTGIYSIAWSTSQTSEIGVVAFLLPDVATAKATIPQLAGQQMGEGTYAANSLVRKVTGSTAGVPGSYSVIYQPSAHAPKGTPTLAITELRYGRVDSIAEAVGTASTVGGQAAELAKREYAVLEKEGGSPSLAVTDYPVGVSAGWIAGAVVLAAAFALVPVLRRSRRDRRRRAYEAEMANRVVVKGRVIAKRRV